MSHQYIYTMKGLGKSYGPGQDVLKDIWLSFLPGAKIGVLGLNGAGKSTVLRIMAGENLAGTEVWLRIRDNGPGMSEDVRRRIFDPFYTTKSDGTGLGLALSKKVVESHGGSLEVQADSNSGTEFLLTFPQAHAARKTST